MRKVIQANLMLILATLFLSAGAVFAEGVQQPVFLMCPHHAKYDAWSVYVTVDKSDPSKLLSLGLDKLVGKNSEDLKPNGFENVLAAQKDAGTKRESLGTLDVKNFGSGQIKIEKDDALHLSMTPVDASTYRLVISMRCTSDMRFNVGGKDASTRDVLVKYDAAAKTWNSVAMKMIDINGRSVIDEGMGIVGINFPVTGTGIYRIIGVLQNGDAVVLVDGWRRD